MALELVSSILELGKSLWGVGKKHTAYITELKEILVTLRKEMEELEAMSEDVKIRLEAAEGQGMRPRKEVLVWLKRMETTHEKVKRFLQQGAASHEGEHQPPKLILSYKVGKKATKMISLIKELSSKGAKFEEVAHQRYFLGATSKTTEGYSEMPLEKTVGMESIFEDVWERLEDDNVGIVGLYGMGGVGKTTLLKRINNELPRRKKTFNVALWIVASKQATVESIQRDILRKLRIPYQRWIEEPVHVKSTLICQFMKGKKFMLMLDDVWERLDLSEVGLPQPDSQNRCKIVFTTRSEEVCGLMEARARIKVTCLSWEKAWALFQEKVGEETLSSHYEIPQLAQMAAKECDGLPLALVTVGRAMACRKSPYEWSHALRLLRKYPSKFSSMANHVLPVLKFSYDSLPDEAIKACFVYCSIFPEDYEIPSNKLVDLWIAEGFLNEFADVSEARNHGLYVVESLKLACLLESGTSPMRVKMHDVMRDMALWIACGYGEWNNRFLILESTDLMGAQNNTPERSEKIEKLSLVGGMIKEPILTSLCSKLSTLVINDTYLQQLPVGLFQLIPNVRILDLSRNQSLMQLPAEISKLTQLEYLNVSSTRLRRLPEQLNSLVKLKHLLLNYMDNLQECSFDVSCLTELRVFRMNYGPQYRDAFLKGLNKLQHIKEISIYLHSAETLETFLDSRKLQAYVRYLRLEKRIDRNATSVQLSVTNLKDLEGLQIYGCRNLQMLEVEEIDKEEDVTHKSHMDEPEGLVDNSRFASNTYSNLQHVIIYHCYQLIDLGQLVNHAPCLQNLWISRCKITCITPINKTEIQEHGVFSRLKRIRLDNLNNLTRLCAPAPFPCLEEVYVISCPLLNYLPFDSTSTTNSLALIKGTKIWWDNLFWKDLSLGSHFHSYFKRWTTQEMETIHGPKRDATLEWPESSTYINPYNIPNDTECAHVLRSSMRMWEE